MALSMASSTFAGVRVQARVTAKNTRAKTVIMANSSGPKRVSGHLKSFSPPSFFFFLHSIFPGIDSIREA